MKVIIDKSWLTKINKQNLIKFAQYHSLILIDTFAYEITSTDLADKKKSNQTLSLWQKLDCVHESINLIADYWHFFDYEIKNKQPISHLEDHYLPINFHKLTKRAINKKIRLNGIGTKLNKYFEIDSIKTYKEISAGAFNYLPELQDISKGCTKEEIIEIFDKVATDDDFIFYVYNDVRPDYFPSSKEINRSSIIFRWLQTQLIYAVDYIRKYGANNLDIYTKKFINTNLDKNYLISCVLADGLATNDNDMSFFFKKLYPDKFYSNK